MSTQSATVHHHGGARTYATVLTALLALTGITVFAAGMEFGSLNVVIALAIATAKASLVALFFMHLKGDKPMNAIIFVSGVIALGIFLGLSFIDTGSRAVVRPVRPAAIAVPAHR
jgi:cytochrome c oxidase subunit IV